MFSRRLVRVSILHFLSFWPPRLCSVLLYKSWQHFGSERCGCSTGSITIGSDPFITGMAPYECGLLRARLGVLRPNVVYTRGNRLTSKTPLNAPMVYRRRRTDSGPCALSPLPSCCTVQSSMKMVYCRTNPVALMPAVNGKCIRGSLLPEPLKQPIRSTLSQ